MNAGAAQRDLSPTRPMPLCGYPHVERLSTGIHDPLLAAALYLENGADAVLLVALDLIMLNSGFARALRRRVAGAVGLPEARVLISCSHTHSAPVTLRYLPFTIPALEAGYMQFCADQIVAAAMEAKQNARPAELGWTTGDGTGVGGNRHAPTGPTDPEVGVLAVRTAGKLTAVAMIYGMHPTVMHEDSTLVSADFPAFARACIPAPVVLYHTAPCGDQSPRHFVNGQTFAEAERLGRKLGEVVACRLAAVKYTNDPKLTGAIATTDLPRRQLPTVAEAEALLAQRRREFEQATDRPQKRTAEVAVFGAEAALHLAQADTAQVYAEILPAEVQVLRIGEACVVGFPGEMFVEYPLDLKRRAPVKTFVTAYANGELQGYIVTPGAQGYEASSSLFAPAAGRVLVETALGLIQ